MTDDEAASIRHIVEATVAEARAHLPGLVEELYVLVHQTTTVMAETGAGGYALGPHVVRIDFDPALDMVAVARRSVRHTLLHELHHAARLAVRPQEVALVSWPATAVFEGLASVFESTVGGIDVPWRAYDEDVIEAWATELFAQPVDEHAHWWRFAHPDGRTAIVYRVGSWIVDRAAARSARTAADLVGVSAEEVLELAGLDTWP